MCALERAKLTSEQDLRTVDGESLYEKKQTQRDALANSLRETRQERDVLLMDSQKFITKIRSWFGKSKSQEKLRFEAKDLDRKAESLKWGEKREIAIESINNMREAIQKSVNAPTMRLASIVDRSPYQGGRITEEDMEIIDNFSIDNFTTVMNNPDLRDEALHSVTRLLGGKQEYEDILYRLKRYNEQGQEDLSEVFKKVSRETVRAIFNADSHNDEFASPERTLLCLRTGLSEVESELNEEGKSKLVNIVVKQIQDLTQLHTLSRIDSLIDTVLEIDTTGACKQVLDEKIEGMLALKNVETYFENYLHSSGYVFQKANELYAPKFEQEFGMPLDNFREVWGLSKEYYVDRGQFNDLPSNVGHMRTIESQRPGAAKVLFEEFNIREFRRYSPELLIKQFDERDQDIPYGTVLFSNSDHNGSFNTDGDIIDSIQDQLGDKMSVRITEFNSRIDLMKQLIRLDQRYGEQNKIAFAIVGAHGTSRGFDAGSLSGVDQSDFSEGQGVGRLNGFFTEDAEIVLFSCSTGVSGGLAENISREYGKTVTGPDVPTSPDSVQVTFNDLGKPHFDVTYHGVNDISRTYTQGVSINSEE